MSESSSVLTQQEAVSELEETVVPKVVIDRYFSSPQCPYNVEVDAEKLADRLNDLGLTEKQIGKFTVRFEHSPIVERFTGYKGLFIPFQPNTIRIYPDELWWTFKEFKEKAKKVIEEGGEKALKKQFIDIAYKARHFDKDRLWKYLANKDIPEERKQHFVEHLLSTGEMMDRGVSQLIAHESTHRIDLAKRPFVFLGTQYLLAQASHLGVYGIRVGIEAGISAMTNSHFSFGDLGKMVELYFLPGIFALLYDFSPNEKRARKAERNIYKNPEDWKFFSVTPKVKE